MKQHSGSLAQHLLLHLHINISFPIPPQQQSLASFSGPPVKTNQVEISDSIATCAVSLSTYTPGCLLVSMDCFCAAFIAAFNHL